MSREAARTPSPTPHSAQSAAPQESFFVAERNRLVAEIAESLGQVLNNSNALNRKLEESILVGKEFEPVAALWGRFASMMSANGLTPQQQQQQGQHDSEAQQDQHQTTDHDQLRRSTQHLQTPRNVASTEETFYQARPSMGVAPGGGTWATSSSNNGPAA